jgi:hypothetical protein
MSKDELSMVSEVKRTTININGKTVSIGVDRHKQSRRVTALVEGRGAFGAAPA